MKSLIIFCSVFFVLLSGHSTQATSVSSPSSLWVDTTLRQMSLDEKIGQLFMIAAYSNQTADYENQLEKLIRKYHIGGLIFFQGNPARQAELTRRYQKISKYPLLIGMDAEHGLGWRLQTAMEFPKMLIAGAVQEDSLIYSLGAAIAEHCRELGVHVNFAPVVDINSNPGNPIIGMRSFGEQREEVTRKAILYMQGTLSQNVLPVAKHFPGHGDTDTDSHHTLPLIRQNRQRLDSIELYPYRKMIEAHLPAIMVSHLNVKALDATQTPASLSAPVIEGLLKGEMQFRGLCFTDALNMKGVTQNTPSGKAEVKALQAGNDVLLFPENLEKAVEEIKKAVREKQLSIASIDEKCRKILLAKAQYVLPDILPADTPGLWSRLNTPAGFALKQNLYKSALTLVRNQQSLLPLKRLDTLRIASINFGSAEINNFQTTLDHYSQISHFTIEKNISEEKLDACLQNLTPYNCIIVYNNLANNSSGKNFGYSSALSRLLSSLPEKKIILCHPAIPYGLSPYMQLPVDAVVINYENHLYAQQYAAQGIFGGVAMNGRLPVRINEKYPAGTGISTPKTRLGYVSPEMCGISSTALRSIDSLCEKAIRTHATPGCQVLAAKNGYVFYNKAFGFHTYQKQQANHPSDIYDIASVTKITATLPALMKLYDDRRISLNDPLSHYYSPLQNTDKKDLTLKEILCHNAGLKAFLPLFADAIDKKSMPGPLFTVKRTAYNTTRLKEHLYANLNYRFRDSTISNTPKAGYLYLSPGLYIYPSYRDTLWQSILQSPLNARKEYAYSDLGFILLQQAVENLTQQPLDQYCQTAFYKRLGMNHTDFQAAERLNKKQIVPSCIDKLYRKTEIRGHVHDPAAAMLGGIAGHAGLFSTADDLAKILQMYLNGGTYGDEYYLSPQTLATFTGKNDMFPLNRRGLGFDKPEPETGKPGPTCSSVPLSSYGHTGFTGIMAWCDPENQLLYIFLSNRTYPDEFNTKLSEENIRTCIQEILYQALPKEQENFRFTEK